MTTMTEDRKYNGWTNYETWATKLWMDNDEGLYLYWKERAGATVHAHKLADELKEWHIDNMPEIDGLYNDLLHGALSEVNWYEIAEALMEDNA